MKHSKSRAIYALTKKDNHILNTRQLVNTKPQIICFVAARLAMFYSYLIEFDDGIGMAESLFDL